jgi:hypothetical protein
MRGKENSAKKVNCVRSPVHTRSWTAKYGEQTEAKPKRVVSTKKAPTEKPKAVAQSKTSTTKKSTTVKVPAKGTSSAKGISLLDNNSLEHIFEYVGAYDTIWNVRRVCKKWNEVAQKVILFLFCLILEGHFGSLFYQTKWVARRLFN